MSTCEELHYLAVGQPRARKAKDRKACPRKRKTRFSEGSKAAFQQEGEDRPRHPSQELRREKCPTELDTSKSPVASARLL